jgi:hypothetical protein
MKKVVLKAFEPVLERADLTASYIRDRNASPARIDEGGSIGTSIPGSKARAKAGW